MPIDPFDSIQLLVLDVDGVLTDGGIYVADDGSELKRYDVTDGLGIRVWERLGFSTAIITGRTGDNVSHRAAYLGIGDVSLGSRDKAACLDGLLKRRGLSPANAAFLGDDWPDLPALRRVGYPMAVGNAAPAVMQLARHVTKARGGHGAVREAIEHLLEGKGLMQKALALYA